MTASFQSSAAGMPARASLPVVQTPDEAAEAVILAASRNGCPDSFRHLVERYQQRIYHFCFHYLRDAGDAREACQDTFIRAHRALPKYHPKARFSTWLFQIALNLCRDRVRASGTSRATEALGNTALQLPCPAATPDEAAMRDTDLAKLDRGLAALQEEHRSVLVLSCLEGLSHAECAEILKCSERAVEGRLYRARQRLAEWWEKDQH